MRVMKIKRGIICSLLVFAAAIGLIIATPGLSGEARAVNLDENCSLTVAPVDPGNEMAADVAQANVVIDLYKVADAVPSGGDDTYTYQFPEGYQMLEDIYKNDPSNADWQRMAQSAARYVRDTLSGQNGQAQQDQTQQDRLRLVKSGVPANSAAGGLDCGLYLLIARGEGIDNYWTTVGREDGGENIATVADSGRYAYTFLPELISLPSKIVRNEDGTLSNTMTGQGEWQYAMTVSLKPSQRPRYGSIEIVKLLESYETSRPATFVFQVEATLNGEKVRSTVASLTFTEAGYKSVIVDWIPVGAEVTVTEVYSGHAYRLTSDSEQRVTIEAVDVVPVEFSNEYDETNSGGGSVTNHFAYDEAQGQWGWTQIQDSTSGE